MSGIDEEVVAQLRSQHAAGADATSLIQSLMMQLGIAEPSRPVVFGYLYRSFNIPLGNLSDIGAWSGFGDPAGFDDVEFNRRVALLIQEHAG